MDGWVRPYLGGICERGKLAGIALDDGCLPGVQERRGGRAAVGGRADADRVEDDRFAVKVVIEPWRRCTL